MVSSPTVRRLQLGRELRRLRERAGLLRDAAAAELECDASKISRVETGKLTIAAGEVKVLLDLYGGDEDERAHVLDLARQARKRTQYRVPDWARTYVGLEAGAAEIKTYEAELVPGLLQTEAYTRAVTHAADPTRSPAEVERLVATRGDRQARLTAADPPQLWVVMNEAVIRREVGGSSVMAEQMEQLVELSELPHVSLQILPFEAGAHAAMGTSFAMIRLTEPSDAEIVYLEDLRSADYVDREPHITAYRNVFDRLATAAAGEEKSVCMMIDAMEGLR